MPIKVNVDARKAFRKLQRAQRLALLAGEKTIENLSELGKVRAKEIAPYFTGRTAKLIRKLPVRKTPDGLSGGVISPNPKHHYGSEKSIIARKYGGSVVKFLHSPDYPNIVKNRTGQPYYMYKVADYLNRKKRRVAQAEFNKIKLR